MPNIYAILEESAKKDFPKIPSGVVSKIVREVVEETENTCYERLANGLTFDTNSILKFLKERYNIEGDSEYIKNAFKKLNKEKKNPTEKEKLSLAIGIIGMFKMDADLIRYQIGEQ